MTLKMKVNVKHNSISYEGEGFTSPKVHQSEGPVVRRFSSPKVHQSEGSVVRRFTSPKVQQSEVIRFPLVRRFTSPKVHQSEGSLVRRFASLQGISQTTTDCSRIDIVSVLHARVILIRCRFEHLIDIDMAIAKQYLNSTQPKTVIKIKVTPRRSIRMGK